MPFVQTHDDVSLFYRDWGDGEPVVFCAAREDVVKFRWEMVAAGGAVAGVGLEILMLDPAGRIGTAYQFIEG